MKINYRFFYKYYFIPILSVFFFCKCTTQKMIFLINKNEIILLFHISFGKKNKITLFEMSIDEERKLM